MKLLREKKSGKTTKQESNTGSRTNFRTTLYTLKVGLGIS